MAQLTPADFNKPCLMTYGEIAERLAYWMALATAPEGTPGEARVADDGDLGWPEQIGSERESWAQRIAAGLLKLSTEDVR